MHRVHAHRPAQGGGRPVALRDRRRERPGHGRAGGALWASGARFTGPLTASDAAALTLCGSTLTGPLTVSGTTGPVVVGDPPACAPNTITGPVRIVRNLGGVTFDGNRVIGSVTIANNNGGIDVGGNPSPAR